MCLLRQRLSHPSHGDINKFLPTRLHKWCGMSERLAE
eukprot:gene1983-5063_t